MLVITLVLPASRTATAAMMQHHVAPAAIATNWTTTVYVSSDLTVLRLPTVLHAPQSQDAFSVLLASRRSTQLSAVLSVEMDCSLQLSSVILATSLMDA